MRDAEYFGSSRTNFCMALENRCSIQGVTQWKCFKYNERRKLRLRIQFQKTCLIVVRRFASRIHSRCSDHPHDLLFYYILLLLLLLLYVLPRSRGTGPSVLGGSALLLDEPASAELRSNMLVIFREAEVAFLAASVLAFGPGLRAVALLVLPSGRPRLEPSSP